jgi:hypothetical protein
LTKLSDVVSFVRAMPTVEQSFPSGSSFRQICAWLAFGFLTVFFSASSEATPTILVQPKGQVVTAGYNVTLSVTAAGNPPLSYQWKKGGATLSGQTSSSLVFNNIQSANEGVYSVLVSDSSGSVTSRVVTLGSALGIQWQQSFGGASDDLLYSMQPTSDGGYILGGYSESGISGNKNSTTYGNSDFWIVKLDANGNRQWEKIFGGTGYDELYALQQTGDGGYILGGVSDSGISGNKTNDSFGSFDYWLIKVDASGNKQWDQIFGGDGDDYFSGLQQTSDGGYLAGGFSNSDVSGNKTNSCFGGFDYWVVKINAAGQKLWERSFGGSDDDWLNSLQKRADGGYSLGGYSLSGISGNKTNLGVGGLDYWVVTIDSNGNRQWEQSFGVGESDDYCVARSDASGNKLWDKCFGGTGADDLYSIQQIGNGGYVLGGCSTSEATGNKTSAAFGSGDYWLVGVNSGGEKLWEKVVGGANNDVLRSLYETEDGGFILGGYSYSDVSGNKTTAAFGGYDFWVVKLVITSPPVITSQPQSQTNASGSIVSLSVSASNAFGYQWRRNGENVPGATASIFTVNNFQPSDVGRYDVVIRPGEITSSNAYLFIDGGDIDPPRISILTPKSNQRITDDFSSFVSGTAKDAESGVADVLISLNDGPFVPAAGLSEWWAALDLVPGTNRIDVKAFDLSGKESSVVSRTVFKAILSFFTLSQTGSGTIVSTPSVFGTPVNFAQLDIGRSYKVQAIPAANYVFSNWTGSASSIDSTFNFIMQSNMTLTANFVLNPLLKVAGSYNGLFQQTNATHEGAGFFTMKVKTNFAFSGRLVLDGDPIALSGKFNVDGTVTKLISRAKIGKPDLMLTLALDFVNDTDRATGTVSSDNWTASLEADRAVFSAANPATDYTNNYTLLFPGFANPASGPPGYGYGLIKIKPNGFVVLTGETGDGIKLSQSVPLSKNARWPFYAFLYKSTRNYINGVTLKPAIDTSYYLGSSYGWVTFHDRTPSGEIRQVKTGLTNSVYPNGFTNESALIGALYSPAALGIPVLNMTSGTITLTNGNLSGALVGSGILIKGNNSAVVTSDNNIKFSLSSGTGLINGTFQHPENGNTVTSFRGAVLQGENAGAGHFLGTNRGGLFFLEGD